MFPVFIPQQQSVLPNVSVSNAITSIGLVLPTFLTTTNSPLTANGNLNVVLADQTQSSFFASPSAFNGPPEFRSLVDTDLPNFSTDKITSGILSVERGGTGASSINVLLSGLNAAGQGSNNDITALIALLNITSPSSLNIAASGSISFYPGPSGYNNFYAPVGSGRAAKFFGNNQLLDNTFITFTGANSETEQWSLGNAITASSPVRLFEIYDNIAAKTRFNISEYGTVGMFGNVFARANNNSQKLSFTIESYDFDTCERGIALSYYGTLYPGMSGGLPNGNLGELVFKNLDNAVIYTNSSTPLIFRTNNVEHLRISATGQIGIDQPNPIYPLHFGTTFGNKIGLYGDDSDHYGFGVHSSKRIRYYTKDNAGAHSFGIGNTETFVENVRMAGNGDLIVYNGDLIVKGHIIADGSISSNNTNVHVFYQLLAPGSNIAQEGDLWLDTTNQWHKYISGVWVVITGLDIPTVLAAISNDYYTKIETDSAIAIENTSLVAYVSTVSAFSESQFQDLRTVQSNLSSSFGSQIVTLSSAVTSLSSDTFAQIQDLRTTTATITSAEASDYLTLTSSLTSLSSSTFAELSDLRTSTATITSAVVTDYLTLTSKVTGLSSEAYAQFESLRSTSATITSAQASDYLTLTSKVTGLSSEAYAKFEDLRSTSATITSSQASEYITLTSSLTSLSSNTFATIDDERITRVDNVSSLSQRIDNVVAGTYVVVGQHVFYGSTTPTASGVSLGDVWLKSPEYQWQRYTNTGWLPAPDVDIAGAFAAVDTLRSATTTLSSALATRIDSVSATAGGNSASIIATSSAVATLSGTVEASATLLVNAQNRIAGYKITSNPALGSLFEIAADKLVISSTFTSNPVVGGTIQSWQTPGSVTIAGGNITAGSINLVSAAVSTSLATLDPDKNTKLVDIEEGATVGAIWGNNLLGRPAELTDGRIGMALNTLGTVITRVVPTSAIGEPTTQGLYLGSDYLGFHSGSRWRTYMDNDGHFFLKGNTGNNALAWNGSQLTINGDGVFSGDISAATGTIGGVVLNSNGLTAGSGSVKLNSLGLTLVTSPTYDIDATSIRWRDPTTGFTDGYVNNYNVSGVYSGMNIGSVSSNIGSGISTSGITATATRTSIAGQQTVTFRVIASTTLNQIYGSLCKGNNGTINMPFTGLVIGGTTSSIPTALLDVQGSGAFTGTVTASGFLGNATTATSSPTLTQHTNTGNADSIFTNTVAAGISFTEGYSNVSGLPGWRFYQNMRHSNYGNYWGQQMAYGWEDQPWQIHSRTWSAGTPTAWQQVWTENQPILYGNSKEVMNTSDTYLRINENNTFTNGIWLGSSSLKMYGGELSIGSVGTASSSSIRLIASYNNLNTIQINGNDGSILTNSISVLGADDSTAITFRTGGTKLYDWYGMVVDGDNTHPLRTANGLMVGYPVGDAGNFGTGQSIFIKVDAFANGTMHAAAFSVNSDARGKKDIVDWAPPADAISLLRPTSFKRTGVGGDATEHRTQIGFIAHEVEEVMPELITTTTVLEGGKAINRKAIDMVGLLTALIAEVQQLRSEVNSLKDQASGT